MAEGLQGRYRSICRKVDVEFARNRAIHGNRIRCSPHCVDCCSQLFQITEIEAAEISIAVRGLHEGDRRRLRERAACYIGKRHQLVTLNGEQEAWGSLPPPGARLPCPALENGICTIYEHRPLICRKFGIPLWNPDRPGRVYACELNFREGEEIADPDLIQIQTAIHADWKMLQLTWNDERQPRDAEPITVARAILEDFSTYAP